MVIYPGVKLTTILKTREFFYQMMLPINVEEELFNFFKNMENSTLDWPDIIT